MKRRSLLWQLFPSHLITAILALAVMSWFLSISFRQFYIREATDDLEIRARLIEHQISELSGDGHSEIQRLCDQLGIGAACRVTVVLASGKVICDTEENPAVMENHATRPEIMEAYAGRTGTSVRYSRTLGRDMLYVAIPLDLGEQSGAVLRVSVPLVSIDRAIKSANLRIALGFFMAVIIAAVASFLMSRRIKKPIDELKKGVGLIADGNLDRMVRTRGAVEIEELAESMNEMARHLAERIGTVGLQQRDLEAILSSMIEGVVAVDGNDRIIMINEAAKKQLGADAGASHGKFMQEVIRDINVQRFISDIHSEGRPADEQFRIHTGEETVLQAHGTILRRGDSDSDGVLVVLHDITRIVRLENTRRDFVANVSHELKTPITSIKGFVETLANGAIEDRKEATKFLGIIEKHANRLNSIIDDLFQLSRIERDAESKNIDLTRGPLKPILTSAVDFCKQKAAKKNVTVKLNCADDIELDLNPALLERAVVNLIDNAINYSEAESEIVVEAKVDGGKIVLSVADQGCGIEQKHQGRIFERFYRVDTARSRELGGTGLGLAIVKHIAEAHGGFAKVESELGKGSRFSIYIPAEKSDNKA